jgi:hypothetical protein
VIAYITISVLFFILGAAFTFFLGYYLANKYANETVPYHPTTCDFINYLDAHPQLRFWQALASWSEHQIYARPLTSISCVEVDQLIDTWEWKTRTGTKE